MRMYLTHKLKFHLFLLQSATLLLLLAALAVKAQSTTSEDSATTGIENIDPAVLEPQEINIEELDVTITSLMAGEQVPENNEEVLSRSFINTASNAQIRFTLYTRSEFVATLPPCGCQFAWGCLKLQPFAIINYILLSHITATSYAIIIIMHELGETCCLIFLIYFWKFFCFHEIGKCYRIFAMTDFTKEYVYQQMNGLRLQIEKVA